MSRPLCVLAVTALLASACAQPLQPFGRAAGGGGPPCAFWPPPPPTSTWMGELDAATGRSFGEAAGDLASMLREAGYDALQWYPIGARYEHGFAVTTRLERIDDDGTPRPPSERWSSLHPEAMSLRWLEGARAPRLPGPGRYRALLVAFTDLLVDSGRAPAWEHATLMEGPDAPPELPATRRASPRYRLGFFVYEYRSTREDGHGAFVVEPTVAAAAHVRAARLSR